MRDEIQFVDPDYSVCDCCGGTTTSLTRFVTRNGNAFAVYFGRYSNNHPDGFVSVLVGFGDWSEEVAPEQRTAIAFRIWTHDDSYQVGIVDVDEDHWKTNHLGRRHTRAEALESEWRQEVFDLSDHIVECDLPIIEYLNGQD